MHDERDPGTALREHARNVVGSRRLPPLVGQGHDVDTESRPELLPARAELAV